MANWFLSTRAHSVGGPVAPVKVFDDKGQLGPDPNTGKNNLAALQDDIRGREIFFMAHGFNVNQQNGLNHLSFWFDKLEVGNAIKIGLLWPGDAILPIFVDYVIEGHEAIASGNLLAQFINKYLTGALHLSFASHSLGARVVLQTITGLAKTFSVRRTILMAGAIDDTCLGDEYSSAAKNVEQVSVMASRRDFVLELGYPILSPLQGIVDRGHPYVHGALGREGPSQPYPASLRQALSMPDALDYGHLDYLPGSPISGGFDIPVTNPSDNGANEPPNTPPIFQNTSLWKPVWSAAYASSRFL